MFSDSILSLIRLALGSELEPDVVMDEVTRKELVEQSIEPMIAYALLSMSNDISINNEEVVFRQLEVFSRHLTAQQALNDLLLPEGITPIILKGLSAAYYYPHPEMRVLGDIDIIVSPANDETFRKACSILANNGYAESDRTDKRTSFNKDKIHYEIHRHFSQRRTAKQLELDQYIESSIPKKITMNEYEFYALPDDVIGLVYLDHMAQHLIREGLGLRHIIDWVVYSKYFLNDDKWNDSFGQMADKIGLKQFARTVDKIGSLYLGGDVHLWNKTADDTACYEMMKLVYEMGNFGRKSDEKSNKVVSKLNKHLRNFTDLPKVLYRMPHYIGKIICGNYSVQSALNGYKKYRERKKIFERIGLENYR